MFIINPKASDYPFHYWNYSIECCLSILKNEILKQHSRTQPNSGNPPHTKTIGLLPGQHPALDHMGVEMGQGQSIQTHILPFQYI